jgi:hypothetical protein
MIAAMIPRGLSSFAAIMLVIASLSPAALQAQTAAQAPCAAVSQALLSIDPPGGWRGPWGLPVAALDKASRGVVVSDAEGWRAETPQAGLDKLHELRASQTLKDAIGKLTGGNWLFSLHRFGQSSLHMAEVMQGTMHCRHFVFFDTSPAEASMVAAPPIVRTNDETAFCWRRSAYAGEVAGAAAFITQDDRDDVVGLSITPWREGQWQASCQVTVKFTPQFEVADRYCSSVDCAAIADQALEFAKTIDRGTALVGDSNENFRTLKKLAEEDPPDDDLRALRGTFDSAYSQFAPQSVMVPVMVGGETYLGRIGHAALGWRIWPDYLFAMYKKGDYGLEPIAAIYIRKTRDKPLSVTID